MTIQQFRQDFPEFLDPGRYPDPAVTFWLTMAGLMLNVSRWVELLDIGTELFIAHNLALEVQAQETAANGGVPGLTTGAVASKSVDKISISYDVSAGIEAGAGHWNLTIYGTRLMKLINMIGAGPIQIGIGYYDPMSSQNAWPGVWTGNFPNPSG